MVLQVGDSVEIVAQSQQWAFVDGWCGKITGYNNGATVVECVREDGLKTLFIPDGNGVALFLRVVN